MITRIQFFQTCVESGNFSPLGFPSPKNGAKDPVVLRGRVVSSDWLHRSCCKGVQKHQHTHRLMLGMLLVWWMGRMGMKDLQVENIAIVHQSLKKLYMNIYIYYTYVNIYISCNIVMQNPIQDLPMYFLFKKRIPLRLS